MSRRIVLAGTMTVCALALAFPPWGDYGSFRTFAFLLSQEVPNPDSQWRSLSILWPILAIEVAVILLVGGTCYFLLKGDRPAVERTLREEHTDAPVRQLVDMPSASQVLASETASALPAASPMKSAGEPNQRADHRPRFNAAVIDALIVGLCAILIWYASGPIWIALDDLVAGHDLLFVGRLIAFWIVVLALQAAYYTLTQSSRHMASIGKRMSGLIVVSLDGERISKWRGLLRFVVFYVSASFTLPLACVLMNRRHLAIHDYVSGTIVLKKSSYDPTSWDYSISGAQIGRLIQGKSTPRVDRQITERRASVLIAILLTISLLVVLVGQVSSIYRDEIRARQPQSAERSFSRVVVAPGDKAIFQGSLEEAKQPQVGGQIFATNCAECHERNGAGFPPNMPSLVGSAVVKGPADRYAALVLNGKSFMPGFRHLLSDADIAAVMTYTRISWGNDTGMVQAAQVAAKRNPSWRDLIEDRPAEDLPPAQDAARSDLGSAHPNGAEPEILNVAAPRAPALGDKSPRDLFTIVATAAADDGTRKDVPVKGGWGYTIDDAIIIDRDDPTLPKDAPFNGVGLEYELAKYRSVIELADSGHFNAEEMDDRFSIEHNRLRQRTFSQGGRQYDVLTFEITARSQRKAIQYTANYYFDITSFYGTGQPIFGDRFPGGKLEMSP